jgi:cell division septation protein DedD
LKHLQKILLIVLLAVIALTVFGVSFKMGEMIFSAYKTKAKVQLQGNVDQSGQEMSGMAVAPKADKQREKEGVKRKVNESAPIKIVESASGKVEKVGNTGMKKNMIQLPAENIAVPVDKAEKTIAAAKPEVTAPAAIASAVQPAIKPPESLPKQKMAAQATKKLKEYKVVAASYSTEASAGPLIDQLKTENYRPIVVQANLSAGRFYRVIVGSHGSLSEAHDQMAELKKLGLQPFCIVE